MSTLHSFDATQLHELFSKLGKLAAARGVELDVIIVGGAAMALSFDSRRSYCANGTSGHVTSWMMFGRRSRMLVDDLARAARDRRAFDLRVLWRSLLDADTTVSKVPPPVTDDPELRAIGASLVELLAVRLGQVPPAWTAAVEHLDHELELVTVRTAERRARLREETPAPLRDRGLIAPADFLTVA